MTRKASPSFVLTRRLITTKSDAAYINKKMRIVERLYNVGIKHYLRLLDKVKVDYWYQYSLKMYKAAKDLNEQKLWANEIFSLVKDLALRFCLRITTDTPGIYEMFFRKIKPRPF